MSHLPLPTQTPNVVISNPNVRVALRTALDVIGAAAFIAVAVDISSPAFDIASLTTPVLTGYAAARTVFGFAVDNTNTPR
jgi:hypothetical protein